MKLNSLLTFIAFSLYAAPATLAETQGDLDPTSIGTFDVTFTLPDLVKITGMQDINFGQHNSGDFNYDHSLCIYSNTPTATYSITAAGTGAGSSFRLSNGTDNINYNVYWNDIGGSTAGEVAVTAGLKLTNQSGADQTDESCAVTGNNANLHIEVLDANMSNITNGIYTGTLTILLEAS